MNQYTFYFAGELFSQKHLVGNALLADAIYTKSEQKYLPILPQDLEFRSTQPKAIRDHDLLGLLQSDLALFHFDGPELDSGTVVEFMLAKFADIPSVVIRTDFRDGGDQDGKGDPWNLMCSFYPRTEVISLPSIETARQSGHQRQDLNNYNPDLLYQNVMAHGEAIALTAHNIICAFDAVLGQPPVLSSDLVTPIYQHLQKFANFGGDEATIKATIEQALERKKSKALL